MNEKINVIYEKEKIKTEFEKDPFNYNTWVDENKNLLKPPGKKTFNFSVKLFNVQ